MSKYVFAYLGGSMGETPEEQEASMNAWMAWFGSLGAAVKDVGNPFVASTTLAPGGTRGSTSAGLTGYSIVEADSIDEAATFASSCPLLSSGGTLEIYEAMPM